MKIILLIDFGSTHTKVLAVDIEKEVIVGRSQSVTTVQTDITIGLKHALTSLFENFSIKECDIVEKYASSSAAGGLRISAVGLVPDLTLEAAKRAALGAGGKVVWSSGYKLDTEKIKRLEDSLCDIILLSGGTDGGNEDTILHNASLLSSAHIEVPILVAGNSAVSERVAQILKNGGKTVDVIDNVLPQLTQLNVNPAQEKIRELFINRITKAKGLDRAQDYIGDLVMPTPKATMQGASFLAEGVGSELGIGTLLVIEVGGATINIHSVDPGHPSDPNTIVKGLPELRIKRTVEGDLGIRYNAPSIIEVVGEKYCIERMHDMDPDFIFDTHQLTRMIRQLSSDVGRIPNCSMENYVDCVLAESAVAVAVQRHVGRLTSEYSFLSEKKVQRGKDLTQTANLIGTGGIFAYGRWPEVILRAALFDPEQPDVLKPRKPDAYIDKAYLLYAMGLLAEAYPEKSVRIAKKYLEPLEIDKEESR